MSNPIFSFISLSRRIGSTPAANYWIASYPAKEVAGLSVDTSNNRVYINNILANATDDSALTVLADGGSPSLLFQRVVNTNNLAEGVNIDYPSPPAIVPGGIGIPYRAFFAFGSQNANSSWSNRLVAVDPTTTNIFACATQNDTYSTSAAQNNVINTSNSDVFVTTKHSIGYGEIHRYFNYELSMPWNNSLRFGHTYAMELMASVSSSDLNSLYTTGAQYDLTEAKSGVYIAKVPSNFAGSTVTWQKRILVSGGASNSLNPGAIAIDSNDNILVGGRCFVSTGGGYPRSWIASISSDGNTINWIRQIYRSNYSSRLTQIAVDNSNNVYIFVNGANLYEKNYIAKYNSSGVLQWQRQIGNDSSARGSGLCIVGNNMYVSMISFSNCWIFKLPIDGSKTGTYTVGGNSITYSNSAGLMVEEAFTGASLGAPTGSYQTTTNPGINTSTLTNSTASPSISFTSV